MKTDSTERAAGTLRITAPAAPVNIRELVNLGHRMRRGHWLNQRIAEVLAAAEHQLAVRRMSAAQLARHDPSCRWCRVLVPWTGKGLEMLLKSRHSGTAPTPELCDLAANRDVAPPEDTK